jgi:hypothetical protein
MAFARAPLTARHSKKQSTGTTAALGRLRHLRLKSIDDLSVLPSPVKTSY